MTYILSDRINVDRKVNGDYRWKVTLYCIHKLYACKNGWIIFILKPYSVITVGIPFANSYSRWIIQPFSIVTWANYSERDKIGYCWRDFLKISNYVKYTWKCNEIRLNSILNLHFRSWKTTKCYNEWTWNDSHLQICIHQVVNSKSMWATGYYGLWLVWFSCCCVFFFSFIYIFKSVDTKWYADFKFDRNFWLGKMKELIRFDTIWCVLCCKG